MMSIFITDEEVENSHIHHIQKTTTFLIQWISLNNRITIIFLLFPASFSSVIVRSTPRTFNFLQNNVKYWIGLLYIHNLDTNSLIAFFEHWQKSSRWTVYHIPMATKGIFNGAVKYAFAVKTSIIGGGCVKCVQHFGRR